jgi:hypothetical protein
MAKTSNDDLCSLEFNLHNARKVVRYYTHLAENLGTPSMVGEAVHQSLLLACALGYGNKFVLLLVEGQQKRTGAKLVPC